MEKLKFIDLLSLTRLILFLGVLFLISCTKRIKEVKIIAYDLVERKGIPGITLYLESGETLTTDENGEAVLTSLGDLTGRLIGIPSFLDEYGDAGLKENCEPTTTYEIKSEILRIPFRKKSVYQVDVYKREMSSNGKGCVYFHDIECLTGVASSIELDENGDLMLPRFTNGNTFYYSVYPINELQEIKIFYGNNCGDDFSQPDSSYSQKVHIGDTTVFVVYI